MQITQLWIRNEILSPEILDEGNLSFYNQKEKKQKQKQNPD